MSQQTDDQAEQAVRELAERLADEYEGELSARHVLLTVAAAFADVRLFGTDMTDSPDMVERLAREELDVRSGRHPDARTRTVPETGRARAKRGQRRVS